VRGVARNCGRDLRARLLHNAAPHAFTEQEPTMKKTIKSKKLQLSRDTLRELATKDLAEAHGGLQDTHSCKCPVFTQLSCSCKHSVCDSCYNTDCCLIVP
jgi:hypothetical protein